MSDEKKPEAKDVELKPFTREILEKQIKASQEVIEKLQAEILRNQRDLEQNIGVFNYTSFLLQKYALPAEPKADPKKKPELEVK